MKGIRTAVLLATFVTALSVDGLCQAQGEDASVFLIQLRDAAQSQSASAYAALFAKTGRWDGPFGQNAVGPANVIAALG